MTPKVPILEYRGPASGFPSPRSRSINETGHLSRLRRACRPEAQGCPHCGGQALGCVGFDPNDPGREPWTGKWPGEADCERLGYVVNDNRDFPDLDRLFRECDWNRERQRWEDRPTRAEGETVH